MSFYPQIYQELRSGQWADTHPDLCPCRGHGWLISDIESYHRCPFHGAGVPHPEDYEADYDGEAHLLEMYRRAFRRYQVSSGLSASDFLAAVRDVARCAQSLPADLAEKPWTGSPSDWVNAAHGVRDDQRVRDDDR